jgi:hypothetical protein
MNKKYWKIIKSIFVAGINVQNIEISTVTILVYVFHWYSSAESKAEHECKLLADLHEYTHGKLVSINTHESKYS